MVLAAAIERAGGGGTSAHFGLKGGVVAEMVEAFDIHQAFGLEGPHELLCISLEYQMAHKIHGATKPPPEDEAENDRVQDAAVREIQLFIDALAVA